MTDLKLIDELLCVMRQQRGYTWEQLEEALHITGEAMRRLRQAYASGEMPAITLGLAKYFEGEQ